MDDTIFQSQICNHIDELALAKVHECDPESCKLHISTDGKAFNILTQNIRSIHKNFSSFELLLARMGFDCDILLLTECWINTDKPIPQLPRFDLAYTSNCLNQNGGIVVYFKSSINCTIEEPDFQDSNCLLIKIGTSIAVIALYRSPSFANIENFLNSLDTVMNLVKTYPTITVIGDINIDIQPENTDRFSSSYLELLASHGLLPGHTLITRGEKCLDHIMLKSKNQCTTVVLQTFLTDHCPALLSIKKTGNLNAPKKIISKTDFNIVTEQLHTTDLSQILHITDANLAAELLMSRLMEIVKVSTRIFKVPQNQRIIKPWITAGLLRCIRTRDRMHAQVKQVQNNRVLTLTYSRYRNFCNKLLKKVKIEYEKSELEKHKKNIKKTWQTIKQITYTAKPKTSCEKLLNLSSNAQLSVDSVNDYFVNVGKNIANQIELNRTVSGNNTNSLSSLPSHIKSIGMIAADEAEIYTILNGLKNECAVGYDGISTSFLKYCSPKIVPLITHLCNVCMDTGTFPKVFKTAIITPVHKGGNGDSITNYRPISVLTALSKILEKVINKRLTSYLESYNILSNSQYGFRSARSTEGAVTGLIDMIVDNIDRKNKVIGIFLDLAKAFDTVSIPILIKKLEIIGCRDTSLKLLSDYLTDRTQKTKIGELISQEQSIAYGVPQGSVLGPSLFLVYVNDLCNLKLNHGRIFSYADDTALIFEGNSWEEVRSRAEEGLKVVMKWLQDNLLALNISKTKFMTFTNPRSRTPVITLKAHANCVNGSNGSCDCTELEQVQNIKYLGVVIDEKLNWKQHIKTLSGRVRKLIYVFKNLREVADRKLLINIYNSLCRSILTYCNTAWGGACVTYLLQLERAQRAVLKVATFRPYRFPTADLYSDCEVLTVRKLFIYNTILSQHKKVNVNENLSTGKRRKDRVLAKPTVHTIFAQRHQSFLGPLLYNKANKAIEGLVHLNQLKCKEALMRWLLTLEYDETEQLLKIMQ